MPFATVDDVAVHAGREFSPSEHQRVQALLDGVSDLVRVYCTKGVPDPVPALVKGVVCTEVIRLLNSNPGVSSERTGDVEVAYTWAASGMALSAAAEKSLNPFRHRHGSARLEAPVDLQQDR